MKFILLSGITLAILSTVKTSSLNQNQYNEPTNYNNYNANYKRQYQFVSDSKYQPNSFNTYAFNKNGDIFSGIHSKLQAMEKKDIKNNVFDNDMFKKNIVISPNDIQLFELPKQKAKNTNQYLNEPIRQIQVQKKTNIQKSKNNLSNTNYEYKQIQTKYEPIIYKTQSKPVMITTSINRNQKTKDPILQNCDQQTIKAVLNNKGCAKWDNGKCVQCAISYYFNKDGICTQIDQNCKLFDGRTNKCVQCYNGYELDYNNNCVLAKVVNVNNDFNCKVFNNGKCIECSYGFYFNDFQKCQQIDPNCKKFNTSSRRCEDCYQGYKLVNGQCQINRQPEVNDPNCNEFQNDVCIKCSYGFYFDDNKKCKQLDPQCKIFDQLSKRCVECYPGYQAYLDKCIVSNKPTVNWDSNCNEFKNGICVRCSYGFYFDQNKKCKQVDSQCKRFDYSRKQCEQCYSGYEVQYDKCVLRTQQLSDPNCNLFENGICVKCSYGFYFDKQHICHQVDPQCKLFNFITLSCDQCYSGYQLQYGKCVLSKPNIGLSDPNCRKFQKGVCVQCSYGFYFDDSKKCIQIDPNCKIFDVCNRKCTGCYQGYQLQGNTCVIPQLKYISNCQIQQNQHLTTQYTPTQTITTVTTKISSLNQNYDKNCDKYIGTYCISCKTGYQFNKFHECVLKW